MFLFYEILVYDYMTTLIFLKSYFVISQNLKDIEEFKEVIKKFITTSTHNYRIIRHFLSSCSV